MVRLETHRIYSLVQWWSIHFRPQLPLLPFDGRKEMREPVSYRCDGCNKLSVNTGNKGWISMRSSNLEIEIINGISDQDGFDHYCGETCGTQAASTVMYGWKMNGAGK